MTDFITLLAALTVIPLFVWWFTGWLEESLRWQR